ncbi:MAG: hypothetical protein IT374_10215 [Polyangiaceae bacterium]|nr:hypothetical protein [Polyangiaceae bacterium]
MSAPRNLPSNGPPAGSSPRARPSTTSVGGGASAAPGGGAKRSRSALARSLVPDPRDGNVTGEPDSRSTVTCESTSATTRADPTSCACARRTPRGERRRQRPACSLASASR